MEAMHAQMTKEIHTHDQLINMEIEVKKQNRSISNYCTTFIKVSKTDPTCELQVCSLIGILSAT